MPLETTIMKLNVVIVSYNSKDTIIDCVMPLHELYLDDYLRVVVIDNHGSDGVPELLAKECPWITVKSMGNNNGFGYGCNAGFRQFSAEYTLFLNPDAIIEKDSLLELMGFLETFPKVAITAPAIFEGDEMQLVGLMPLPSWKNQLAGEEEFQVRAVNPDQEPFETNWLCGAVLLVRSSVFEEIGGFDEKFFLYFEETDLCKRTRDAGYEIWANGKATAVHIGGASSKGDNVDYVDGCIAEHFYRSRFYFFKKHFGSGIAILNDIYELTQISLKSVVRFVGGRKKAFEPVLNRLHSPFFSEPNVAGKN